MAKAMYASGYSTPAEPTREEMRGEIVPCDLLDRHPLSKERIVLALALKKRAERGIVETTYADLEEETGMVYRTVKEALATMIQDGYIVSDTMNKRRKILHIMW